MLLALTPLTKRGSFIKEVSLTFLSLLLLRWNQRSFRKKRWSFCCCFSFSLSSPFSLPPRPQLPETNRRSFSARSLDRSPETSLPRSDTRPDTTSRTSTTSASPLSPNSSSDISSDPSTIGPLTIRFSSIAAMRATSSGSPLTLASSGKSRLSSLPSSSLPRWASGLCFWFRWKDEKSYIFSFNLLALFFKY